MSSVLLRFTKSQKRLTHNLILAVTLNYKDSERDFYTQRVNSVIKNLPSDFQRAYITKQYFITNKN